MNADFHVAVVGSGFAGLGMAIRLKQAGIDDFVVFERANEVGGTWRDNSYPGCTCDVESHLYSFSFAPNPNWSRMWSPQPEILAYLKNCADRFGLRPHIKFNHTVEGATWNDELQHWELRTSGGTFTATVLVSAMGALSEPEIPKLAGIETFQGATFHSARWNHEFDLAGKKVAVLGTGASAVQFVPAIQPKVKKLHLFQRTAPWVLPQYNRDLTEREHHWLARVPWLQKAWRLRIYLFREMTGLAFRHPRLIKILEKVALRYLQRKVPDPVLRAKLTPSFTIGCKRILLSRNYLPALTQKNVEVVTDGIREIQPHGVVTQDGVLREVDAIIFGTGFRLGGIHRAHTLRGKKGMTLADAWAGSPRAFLGTSVTGFPNLFLLFGPNTGLGHSSVMLICETQISHVLNAILFMRRKGTKAVEPKAEAQDAFTSSIDRQMQGTVWTSGCASWYLDATGRNSTLWPGSVGAYRRRALKFRPQDYVLAPVSM
jgi:cation diffusion facilitator CzcD-associated flavoprotein CzcO